MSRKRSRSCTNFIAPCKICQAASRYPNKFAHAWVFRQEYHSQGDRDDGQNGQEDAKAFVFFPQGVDAHEKHH